MIDRKRTVPQSVFDSPEALRIAAAGHKAACDDLDKVPRHMLDIGNPNHPIHDGLFGYDRKTFMSKQYKG